MMPFIAVVDYDSGNVRSVSKALEFVGAKAKVTRNRDEILASDGVILPGVGAFADCMCKLKEYGLVKTIYNFIDTKKPFLGICVGLQLLFEKSFEFGEHEGLGIIEGDVKKFPDKIGYPVPHMGWNSIEIKGKNPIFKDIEDGSYFYFVHSYYAKAKSNELSSTDYVVDFTSSIAKNSVWGLQFHPEKSQKNGLRVLKNFCDICEGRL
jgi:glutamine amidotransferase